MASKQPSKQLRHMACILCRDRKVKCDGGQPSCNRCNKASETCTYPKSVKASKAEIQETIQQLHKRMKQTEANTAAILAQQQKQQAFLGHSSYTPDKGSNSLLAAESTNMEDALTSLPAYSVDIPMETSSSTAGSMQWSYANMDMGFDANNFDFTCSGDQIRFDKSTQLFDESENGAGSDSGFAYHYPMFFESTEKKALDSSRTFSSPTSTVHSRLPSLRDIREWTGSTSGNLSSTGSIGEESMDHSAAQLLQEFISVITVAISSQHNIAGIANTVAEYARYFRRSSSGEDQNSEELESFLITLECRMQEIAHIATQQVLQQALRSRDTLRLHRMYQAQLNELREEQNRHARLISDFFQNEYDLSKPFSQQRLFECAAQLRALNAQNEAS